MAGAPGHVGGPHGGVDHRSRAPGAGYAGGPAATTAKGPPARKGGAGHVGPVQAPAKRQPKVVYKLDVKI